MSELPDLPDEPPGTLDLGGFSMSLAVADLEVSKAFYTTLGFVVLHEVEEPRYAILKNGLTTIGLFQGVIEQNIMTFNPGLLADLSRPASFTDVREIERHLVAEGVELTETTHSDSGPAHLSLVDPDGNVIMIDQFF